MRYKNIIISMIVCISFYLSGCATTKISPNYLDPAFSPANVDSITILPIADLRKDQSVPFGEDWENKIIGDGPGAGWSTEDFFSIKLGYNIAIKKDFGGVSSINEDDFRDAQPSWVKKLGPEDARWILLVVLEDFVSEKTVGTDGNYSATLYDKEYGKTVWQHKVETDIPGESKEALGGALAGALTGGVIGGVIVGVAQPLLTKNQDYLRKAFFNELIASQFPTEHGFCTFCAWHYKK